ncbi:MAG: DUF6134 family protein [Woeseiaceae bacterium]
MTRFDGLVCAALLVCAPVLRAAANVSVDAPGLRWQFDVALNGKPVGNHSFTVRQDGSLRVLETNASFDVKFLFVTAFRYRHQNTEVWTNGCLSSIEATTDSNGKKLSVRGSSAVDGFELSSNAGSATLSGCIQSFAYWNPAVLESNKLLNSQTGEYEDVMVTLEQREQLDVGGESVDTLRYRLSAKSGDISLWYSSEDRTWLRLEAPARGGRTISYTAVAVPEKNSVAQLLAASG